MLNNLNEWQDIIRDKTSPSLSIIEGSVATVPFGTNSFSSGLVAFDDGEDISYDIIAQEGFDTFIPDGVTMVSFTVTDKGGNSETLSREVSIIGGWSESTISFYDFTQISGLPQNFLPQNGEWEISDEGLKPIGEMPDSPRWVITSDVDANCDFQVSYTANGAGNLLGLVYRFVDVQNFSWVYLKDGELAVRERINGADIAIASSFVSSFSADEEYIVGLTAKDKDLSVYVNGELKITTESEANTFSRKFGILLVNGDSLITKAQFSKPHTLIHGIFAMNQPPTANAGPDQSVAAGVPVQVSASGSTDGDGTIVGWKWRETTNSGVVLSSTTAENISFTSPVSDTAQTITLELIVTDDKGADSVPVYVDFTVNPYEFSYGGAPVLHLKAKAVGSINPLVSTVKDPTPTIQESFLGSKLLLDVDTHVGFGQQLSSIDMSTLVNYFLIIKKPNGVVVQKVSYFSRLTGYKLRLNFHFFCCTFL